MAAWTATELWRTYKASDVGVTLTPVGQGRFEVYLDGELVYNCKDRDVTGISSEDIKEIRKLIVPKLEVTAAAG